MPKNPITSFSKLLLTLNPFEFATLGYILGILLSEGLDSNEQSALGNFYNLLGETIQTIGAQAQNLSSPPPDNPDLEDTIASLKNKIGNIEDLIAKFKNI